LRDVDGLTTSGYHRLTTTLRSPPDPTVRSLRFQPAHTSPDMRFSLIRRAGETISMPVLQPKYRRGLRLEKARRRDPQAASPVGAPRRGHATAAQFCEIISTTSVVHHPPKGRFWTYTEQRFEELAAARPCPDRKAMMEERVLKQYIQGCSPLAFQFVRR
jgi:hypothetical protein